MTAPPTPPSGATIGDLHKLARRTLGPLRALFPPHTRSPAVREALGHLGYGLNWLDGEHVIAFLHHSDDPFAGLLLTDRSLLAAVDDDRLILAVDHLTGAELTEGFLHSTLVLTTRDKATHELPLTRDAQPLLPALQELAALDYTPTRRAAPMARVTQDDPTGLRHLVETLSNPDPAVVALATLAFALHQADRLPAEAGWDMTVRLQCLHRTFTYGRACRPGLAWLSPLRPADLAQLLSALHTDPVTVSHNGPKTILDIAPPATADAQAAQVDAPSLEERVIERVATTLLNTLARRVGTDLDTLIDAEATRLRLTLTAGPDTRTLTENAPAQRGGSGWLGQKIAAISALAGPWMGTADDDLSGPLATFQLSGELTTGMVDLSRRKPHLLRDLSRNLAVLEVRALAWRLLDGWATPAAQLLTRPEASLLAQLTPHLDASQVRVLVGS
ncbi:MAG: hypothetical protein AAFX99_14340 [Myxococcota bacterium]